jgi:hypothetical protein
MSQSKRKYDSTIAQIAGNIASGFFHDRTFVPNVASHEITKKAVSLARAIVAETLRTEPEEEQQS